MRIITLFSLSSVLLLSSCSIKMAAKHEGVSLEKVQQAKTRAQFLACNPKIIKSEKNDAGKLSEEYLLTKERGSIARALLHGFLDLNTLFLWEAIGTPIESAFNKDEFFAIKVLYNDKECIERVELI